MKYLRTLLLLILSVGLLIACSGGDDAASLPPLMVAAERVAATVAQGVHGRRRIGVGETFWQFRQYEYGDRPETIDWRQSAKSDRVFVREMEWEAAQSIWLWRDLSHSMDWRSGANHPTKRERADLLTLALAALLGQAVKPKGRVGIILSGGNIDSST